MLEGDVEADSGVDTETEEKYIERGKISKLRGKFYSLKAARCYHAT